jgi:Mlc titration factor MtfA (ptsG expression regulator)
LLGTILFNLAADVNIATLAIFSGGGRAAGRLGCAVILGFLNERRRRRLRARRFSESWLGAIKRNVAFFRRLSANDREELLRHIQVFLAEKRFEGCGGMEITDEVRATIGAQACLLLLHRKTDYFPQLLTILVYPSTYLVDENRPVEGPVWEEGKMSRLGETGRTMGSMVLAWDAVKSGAEDPSDGKNVVLHEFAHQLDYENFAADGAPALATRKQQLAWREVMRTEFASLRAAEETGIPTLLDTYGATNPAEFFAVSTEAFFERPRMLRAQYPKLYAELQSYFQQDPVEFSAEQFRI